MEIQSSKLHCLRASAGAIMMYPMVLAYMLGAPKVSFPVWGFFGGDKGGEQNKKG